MDNEAQFLQQLGPEILDLVERSLASNTVSLVKSHDNDFATQIDIDVENLIVTAIQEQFPDDTIMAEEGYSDQSIVDGRLWIIDPICGTNNLGRNISNYCSNTALAIDGELVAALVVDFSEQTYYWSVGGGTVYRENDRYQWQKSVPGVVVDVDYGAADGTALDVQRAHSQAVSRLQQNHHYGIVSLNTSLSVLYSAIGKLDGVLYCATNPWDAAAGVFLQRQLGGNVLNMNGTDWKPSREGYVMARDADVLQTLLGAWRDSV